MLLFDDFALEPEAVLAGHVVPPPPEPAMPARLAGEVIRIVRPLPAKTRGVLVSVKGHAEECAMILRTSTMRPGQCYQAKLNVRAEWLTMNLLLSDFSPKGGVLRRQPRPETLHSYAILPSAGAVSITRVRFY